jgi:hypothetical protein
MLASLLFPYDDDAPALIDGWLGELEQEGCIRRYKVGGQSYVEVCNWLIHQKIDKPSKSKMPSFESIREDSRIVVVGRDQGKDQGQDQGKEEDQGPLGSDAASGIEPEDRRKDTERREAARKTWESYATAYFGRYSTEPVRNAKVNSNILQFVDRLGREEAPHVARFFVGHNNGYYVREMHSVGAMLKDAEKLRTEWATNSKMTQTKAMQADKTQTNHDAFAPLIAAARAKEEAERSANAD